MGITCSSARSMARRRSRRRPRRPPRRPPPPSPLQDRRVVAHPRPDLVPLLLPSPVVSSPLARLTEADAFRTTSRLSYRVSSPLIYCRGITSEAGQTDRWPGPGDRESADPETFGMCVFKSVLGTSWFPNRGCDRKREKGSCTLPRAWPGRWRWSN